MMVDRRTGVGRIPRLATVRSIMSLAESHERLQLPETLQAQLHEFRRRVWSIKMVEAVCAAAFGVVVAFLLMFAARPRRGTRRAGSAPALFAAAVRRLRDRARWRCTAGSGGTAGSSSSPGC